MHLDNIPPSVLIDTNVYILPKFVKQKLQN